MNRFFGRYCKKVISGLVAAVFVIGSVGTSYAQSVVLMSAPGTMVSLSEPFVPPLLKGIKIYRNDPFRFDFILDTGDDPESVQQLKTDANRLIKYFLASLTVPEKDLWVNLSPYEKDRIVPDAFGQTEMGRDLLAQDYILKQITASVFYPEGKIGKEFWGKVYAEMLKRYGTTDIPVDTFNKVWIIPEKATVYENKDAAVVVESKLKVMLEEDYLALDKNIAVKEQAMPTTNKLGSDIVREVVIPILEKEVNEGKNFAPLRQVYNSLILATWYKRKVKESILGRAYVDQQKTAGIDIADKNENEIIYQQYVETFKKGAYNLIKEEYDPTTQETIPRKYFSGGIDWAMNNVFEKKPVGLETLTRIRFIRAMIITMITRPLKKVIQVGRTVDDKSEAVTMGDSRPRVEQLPLNVYIASPHISRESVLQAMQNSPFIKVTDGNVIETYDNFPWSIQATSYDTIDQFFQSSVAAMAGQKGRSLFAHIIRMARAEPDKVHYVLDWGAGRLDSALNDLIHRLRGEGIKNVHILAFGNVLDSRIINFPEVSFIFGRAQDLFGQLDKMGVRGKVIAGWGFASVTHYLINLNFSDRADYVHNILKYFAPEGVFCAHIPFDSGHWDYYKMEGHGRVLTDRGTLLFLGDGSGIGPSANSVDTEEVPAYQANDHLSTEGSGDGAQTDRSDRGGIDLAAERMKVENKSSGGEIQFNVDPVMLDRMQNADGLESEIIGMERFDNLPRFLGVYGISSPPVGG
ncbi:MAG: hypothetical protein HQL20_05630 [Candidatus Omnitrophica bacterium]|nr:hypothetical protein [Candidatus Omnitrophota bacterium]